MHPEYRRRPRTASPRLEALETLVLLNGDLAVVPEAASTPEVVSSPAPDQSMESSADPGATGGDVILSVFTAEDQASDSSDAASGSAPPADEPTAAETPGAETVQTTSAPADPPSAEEVPAAPPAEETAPSPPVEEVPPAPPAAEDVVTAPVDPVEPLPPPIESPTPPIEAPPAVDSSPTAPVAAVPISAPATPPPGPRIEVAPTAENLRIDLAVERTSNLAGRTIRFHTRETNIGTDPIRLTPLNDFDVVVEQNGTIVWKLSDVRRTRAALLPSQAFEPLASRGVSVWWDGFRSRGGRLPVSGDVVVYSTMDGVDSARQTIRIEPTPVNPPRPAPQPVRVEILPPTPPPPTPVLPPATTSTPPAPTTAASTPITPPPAAPADPVPAGSASTAPGTSVAPPPSSIGSSAPVAGLPTTPTTPAANIDNEASTSTTTSTGGAATTTTVSPAEDPTDAATTGQPEVTTQIGGRRRWNTAIYGAVGQAWKQKRFQIPRPTTKPLTGVQHGIRQARLARAEALANRLR